MDLFLLVGIRVQDNILFNDSIIKDHVILKQNYEKEKFRTRLKYIIERNKREKQETEKMIVYLTNEFLEKLSFTIETVNIYRKRKTFREVS